MNPYLEPDGFLGTGASLLADLSLLAYILLIVPAMIAGYYFARRGMHRPAHKWTMIFVTAINWVLIIFLMIVAYRFDVAANILQQPGNPRYLLPTIHGLLGIPAQLLATYVVYRMWREDTQVAVAKAHGAPKEQLRQYWYLSAKPAMRITLVLWLATSLLGVFNYVVRYNLVPSAMTSSVPPAATEEALTTPQVTDEAVADSIVLTDEPAVTPAVTPEVDDDNSGMGMGSDDPPGDDNSGMGMGGDDGEDDD